MLFYFIGTPLSLKKKLLIWTNDYNAVSTDINLPRYLTSKQNNVEFNDLNLVTSIY